MPDIKPLTLNLTSSAQACKLYSSSCNWICTEKRLPAIMSEPDMSKRDNSSDD